MNHASEILRHIRDTRPAGMTGQEILLHVQTSAAQCAELLTRDATGKQARRMLQTAADLIEKAERYCKMFWRKR